MDQFITFLQGIGLFFFSGVLGVTLASLHVTQKVALRWMAVIPLIMVVFLTMILTSAPLFGPLWLQFAVLIVVPLAGAYIGLRALVLRSAEESEAA